MTDTERLHRDGPLRAFVAFQDAHTEILECGHANPMTGVRISKRRRCSGCRDGRPPEYAPSWVAWLTEQTRIDAFPRPREDELLRFIAEHPDKDVLALRDALARTGRKLDTGTLTSLLERRRIAPVHPDRPFGPYRLTE